MTHSEAVQQMAAERYLLDELTPVMRDAFEEHVFDCQECALDLRAAAAFIDEAKVQLPLHTMPSPKPQPAFGKEPKRQRFSWLSPAFAVPTFAVLLLVIGYQNVAVIPGLRTAATQPRVMPWASVHLGTRGAAPISVVADRKDGVNLLVDVPQQPTYPTYMCELYDADGKPVWKIPGFAPGENANGALSVAISGQGLHEGAYTLAISGMLPSGEATEIGRRALQVSFGN
jgi:hypothetical protein